MTSGLTSTEICDIIKACGDSGVTSLSLGDLQLCFGDKPEREVVWHAPIVEKDQDLSDNNDDETQHDESPVDLDELALSDPVAYERLMHSIEED